jgi:cysteine synthase A
VAEQLEPDQHVVALMPDRGDRYCETIYSDRYMAEKGLVGVEAAAQPVRIRYGVDVAERWSYAPVPHDGSVPYYAPSVKRSVDLMRELGLE